MINLIKYYKNNTVVSTFTGDDDTVAILFFHLNRLFPLHSEFMVTKTTKEHQEFLLQLYDGGYGWIEVTLNNPMNRT